MGTYIDLSGLDCRSANKAHSELRMEKGLQIFYGSWINTDTNPQPIELVMMTDEEMNEIDERWASQWTNEFIESQIDLGPSETKLINDNLFDLYE